MDVSPETSEKLGEKLTKVVEAAPGHPADYRLAAKAVLTAFLSASGAATVVFFADHSHYTWDAIREAWPMLIAAGFGGILLKFSPNPLSKWRYDKGIEQRAQGRSEFDDRP